LSSYELDKDFKGINQRVLCLQFGILSERLSSKKHQISTASLKGKKDVVFLNRTEILTQTSYFF